MGRIPHVEKRKDSKGRKQPARKSPKTKRAKTTNPPPQPSNEMPQQPCGDISSGSTNEAERLRVRIGELQATISEFQAAIKKWEDTVETQRGIIATLESESASLRARVAAPSVTAGDPGPFPEILLRAKQAERAT